MNPEDSGIDTPPWTNHRGI